MDNLKNLPKWQQYAFTVAAIALIAGLSFIVSQSGRDTFVQPSPEDIVSKVGSPDETFPGSASGPRKGGILVLPTEIFATGAAEGLQLPPVAVQNRSNKKADVKVDFIPANGFFASGAPKIDISAKGEAEGRRYIYLDKKKLSLAPGQSAQVGATVVGKPSGNILAGSIGFTILDPALAKRGPEKSGVVFGVRSNLRINSLVFLSWPGAVGDSVALERVRATEAGKGALSFQVRVRGTGGAIASPEGEVVVRNSAGQQVAGGRISAQQRVLPGQERDLLLDAPVSDLKPGKYEAEAKVSAAGSTQSVSWAFSIDSDGTLPSPAADIALSVSPARAKPGKNVAVRLDLKNTGTRNFAPRGEMKLYRQGSEEVLDQRSLELGALAPGDTAGEVQEFTAPKRPGDYEVLLEVQAEDSSLLDQRVVSFAVEASPPPPPGAIDKLRDWMSENPLGAAGVGVLAFGILIALLTLSVAIIQRAKNK